MLHHCHVKVASLSVRSTCKVTQTYEITRGQRPGSQRHSATRSLLLLVVFVSKVHSHSGFAHGMGMAFYDKKSLKAIQTAF